MPMSDLLDEFDRLLAAAAPGPWRHPPGSRRQIESGSRFIAEPYSERDAALIVFLRNHAALLRAAFALAEHSSALYMHPRHTVGAPCATLKYTKGDCLRCDALDAYHDANERFMAFRREAERGN